MATGRPIEKASLRDILDRHVSCAETLLTLLQREKEVLSSQDFEGLQQLCTVKAAAAQELQTLAAQLHRHCGSSDPKAIEIHIEKNAGSAQDRWQTLLQLAARCQQANLENGALLLERQVRVRGLLQLIQRDERPLYGRGGAAPVSSARRALALA